MSTSNIPEISQRETGLLLVGHGSREQVGRDEFLATVRLVAQWAGGAPVEACFLEFATPTIADGFQALMERPTAGRTVRRVVVVPVLLFSAGHAQRDIPAAVTAAANEYPEIDVVQTEHLGCHAEILALSNLRYDEALAAAAPANAENTALVMVGRGSHDADATAEMLRFAQLRWQQTPVAQMATGFVAMAEPKLQEVLDQAATWGVRRVVVQPHLLFGGVLLDRIRDLVARQAQLHPRIEWLLTEHLGPAPHVARAVISRAMATPMGDDLHQNELPALDN
jgi:sirohydrochlorin cobaltochelatase